MVILYFDAIADVLPMQRESLRTQRQD